MQLKWRGESDRPLRSWASCQGPRGRNGVVAPPSHALPGSAYPIPEADRRALTLEARTRTQESGDPPLGQEGTPEAQAGAKQGNHVTPDRGGPQGARKENPSEGPGDA